MQPSTPAFSASPDWCPGPDSNRHFLAEIGF
jgi:hypothetical protein